MLQYCFCFMFGFFGGEACRILAPWPSIEPTPPALESEVLTTGFPGKSPWPLFNKNGHLSLCTCWQRADWLFAAKYRVEICVRSRRLSISLKRWTFCHKSNILNCCCSVTKLCQLFATPWTAAHQASPSFTSSWSWLKLMSTESVMPSNRLILCRPLPLLPSVFPSIKVFSNEVALCIGWPKYWSVSISLFDEYSWLISFSWLVVCLPFNCSTTIQNILAKGFVSSKLVFCADRDANYPRGVICSWPAAYSHPLLLALPWLSLHQLWLSYALKG